MAAAYFISQLYCPIGMSPMGSSGGFHFPWREPAATVVLPNLWCMLGVLVLPSSTKLWQMNYTIFNVGTDVNACSFTQGCMDTVRESALKVDWQKNPLLQPQHAGSMLYQLSYNPDRDKKSKCLNDSQSSAKLKKITLQLCLLRTHQPHRAY